jgi:hypothetical protein
MEGASCILEPARVDGDGGGGWGVWAAYLAGLSPLEATALLYGEYASTGGGGGGGGGGEGAEDDSSWALLVNEMIQTWAALAAVERAMASPGRLLEGEVSVAHVVHASSLPDMLEAYHAVRLDALRPTLGAGGGRSAVAAALAAVASGRGSAASSTPREAVRGLSILLRLSDACEAGGWEGNVPAELRGPAWRMTRASAWAWTCILFLLRHRIVLDGKRLAGAVPSPALMRAAALMTAHWCPGMAGVGAAAAAAEGLPEGGGAPGADVTNSGSSASLLIDPVLASAVREVASRISRSRAEKAEVVAAVGGALSPTIAAKLPPARLGAVLKAVRRLATALSSASELRDVLEDVRGDLVEPLMAAEEGAGGGGGGGGGGALKAAEAAVLFAAIGAAVPSVQGVAGTPHLAAQWRRFSGVLGGLVDALWE